MVGKAVDAAGEAINRLNKLANQTGDDTHRKKARELADTLMRSIEAGRPNEALARAATINAQSRGAMAMAKQQGR